MNAWVQGPSIVAGRWLVANEDGVFSSHSGSLEPFPEANAVRYCAALNKSSRVEVRKADGKTPSHVVLAPAAWAKSVPAGWKLEESEFRQLQREGGAP